MHEVAPRQLVAYAVLAILIGIAGARYARSAFAGGGSGSASAALRSGGAFAADGSTTTTAGADAAGGAGPDITSAGAAGGAAGSAGPAGAATGEAGSAAAAGAIVDVAGAVRRPGVYRLAAGARIDDAVRRAGGPTRHADLDPVNLAAPVADGQQIVVPRHGQAAVLAASPSAAGSPSSAGSASAAGSAAPASPIDLNTASADQLDTIDGVGPATAQKILAYRQQHNGFRSVQELLQVSGIGPKKLAAMRPFVRV